MVENVVLNPGVRQQKVKKDPVVPVHSELFSAIRRMMLCHVEEDMHFIKSVSERQLSHIFSHF